MLIIPPISHPLSCRQPRGGGGGSIDQVASIVSLLTSARCRVGATLLYTLRPRRGHSCRFSDRNELLLTCLYGPNTATHNTVTLQTPRTHKAPGTQARQQPTRSNQHPNNETPADIMSILSLNITEHLSRGSNVEWCEAATSCHAHTVSWASCGSKWGCEVAGGGGVLVRYGGRFVVVYSAACGVCGVCVKAPCLVCFRSVRACAAPSSRSLPPRPPGPLLCYHDQRPANVPPTYHQNRV